MMMSTDVTRRTAAQFGKFLVVGIVNTLFGYGVFATLVLLGISPMLSLVVTYMVGVLFNFATTRKFVFSGSRRSSLLRFVAVYVVIYLFNLALLNLATTAGASPLVGQAICLPVLAMLSFVLFKVQVFPDRD